MQQLIRLGIAALVLVPALSELEAQGKPVLRPIATLPGLAVSDVVVMPKGRIMYYTTNDSLFAHDLTSKQTRFVAKGEFDDISVAPHGDRIAFARYDESGSLEFVWTMPVDPSTGAARGPAQRVSSGHGHEPTISPDGSLLVFVRSDDASGDLIVVPVTGGPERTLSKFGAAVFYMKWTDDSKAVLVSIPANATSAAEVRRVPLTGGPGEVLTSVPATPGSYPWYDGEFTTYQSREQSSGTGQMSYRGPGGEQGLFETPAGSWMRTDPVGGKVRRYVVAAPRPMSVSLVTLGNGATKPLLPSNLRSRSPFFLPDGKRLSVFTSSNGHFDLSIVSVDGTVGRTIALPFEPRGSQMRLSPDGRHIALWSTGGELAVVDVNGGVAKILDAGEGFLGGVRFLRTNRGVRFWRMLKGERTIYDADLDGRLTTVGKLPSNMVTRGFFITDDLLEFATDDGEFVYSVTTGQSTRLPFTERALTGMPSGDGRWLAFQTVAGPGRTGQMRVMTVTGDSARTINLSIQLFRGQPEPSAVFSPDNRVFYVIGQKLGQTQLAIYEVLVNGTGEREVAKFPGSSPADHLDISPDGKLAALTHVRAPTTTVYELDMTPVRRSRR